MRKYLILLLAILAFNLSTEAQPLKRPPLPPHPRGLPAPPSPLRRPALRPAPPRSPKHFHKAKHRKHKHHRRHKFRKHAAVIVSPVPRQITSQTVIVFR